MWWQKCIKPVLSNRYKMHWAKSNNGKYRIELLSKKNFKGAIEVIRTGFCANESACIATEVTKNPAAAEELMELCADAALDGVSLVSVCEDTNEVVGVAFNKLQVRPKKRDEKPYFQIFAEERCKQKESRAHIEFMIKVEEDCNLFEKYHAACSLELMFLATSQSHQGNGLGKLLSKSTLDLGKRLQHGPVSKITIEDLGPKYSHLKYRPIPNVPPKICQAIFTSFITQKIGKSLGFTVDARVPFDKFEYNGKTFAERIGPESPFCELSSKVIDH